MSLKGEADTPDPATEFEKVRKIIRKRGFDIKTEYMQYFSRDFATRHINDPAGKDTYYAGYLQNLKEIEASFFIELSESSIIDEEMQDIIKEADGRLAELEKKVVTLKADYENKSKLSEYQQYHH